MIVYGRRKENALRTRSRRVIVVSIYTWLFLGAGARATPPPTEHGHPSVAVFGGFESPPDIPWNGRIAALSVDPSRSEHVLAASDSGGLFASGDCTPPG